MSNPCDFSYTSHDLYKSKSFKNIRKIKKKDENVFENKDYKGWDFRILRVWSLIENQLLPISSHNDR